MIFKIQVPKGTHMETGKRLPATIHGHLIGFSVVKELVNDTEVLLELEGVELEPGGIINNGSIRIQEVSIVNG
ncbi:hypothetical protein NXV35_21490 [Bacteroides faecis]|jgi:hypothetical protein|nr:hypothetical protein [Bacteroides faecis]